MSPMSEVLKSAESPLGAITEDDVGWLNSLTFIGGMAGTLIWGPVADSKGRKMAGYAIATPFVLGWCLVLFAPWLWALYTARFLLGMGGSGSFILVPLYVGETVQDSLRGSLGSFVMLGFNGGIVLAYLLGGLLRYKTFTLACLCFPVLFLTCFFFLPESPAFLWRRNKIKAEDSLSWFRGRDHKAVQEEISRLASSPKQEKAGLGALFATRGSRKAMLFGLTLFSWQQFCGILVILMNVTGILVKANSSLSPTLGTVLVGVFQLCSSWVSSMVVDRAGRRILLLVSYSSMCVCLLAIALYFHMPEMVPGWVPVAAMSCHVITYALGAGPVPYVVISETLPSQIRGLATSVIVLWGTFLAFASVLSYPKLNSLAGEVFCFVFYAIWCLAGFITTWLLIPETKGVPLDEILARLEGEKPRDPEKNHG